MWGPKLSWGQAPDEAPTETTPKDAAGVNVLAGVVGLMMASPKHKHLFLADLEWALLPPLALKQYRIFTKAGRPVAFATWAFVSEEVEQRLKAGNGKLKPAEWRSGERCWVIDLVSPHAPAAAMVEALKRTVLQGHEVSTCL